MLQRGAIGGWRQIRRAWRMGNSEGRMRKSERDNFLFFPKSTNLQINQLTRPDKTMKAV
jgi:hypothetical protein